MQQVVVPQFLDVEDKIIGPVTVRQFIEMVIGAIFIAILYRLLYLPYFLASAFVVFSIIMIIAFAKINGQVFHIFMLNFFQTMINPKLKIWRKKATLKEIRDDLAKPKEDVLRSVKMSRRPVSSSRLSEIALIIDTGGVYQGEGNNNLTS
ncbi:MAG: PrgI family protein [Parcubacteria group bacterium ADurb.Bin326]|nr:MAG: PrgI family protein [Parcubacteria group bacterium ADurb.Bin326]